VLLARARTLTAVAALTCAGLAGCVCTPQAAAYAHSGTETPQQTLDSFILFWTAGLHDLEFGCLSDGFRQRNGQLSLFNYSAARSELERSMPWLAWFAKAKVVAGEAQGKGAHSFWVEVAGRTVRVNLVREEIGRIRVGDEIVADGPLDLERALTVESDGAVRLKFAPANIYRVYSDAEVTSVRAECAWKIDDFAEVPHDSVPRPHIN
jgi:hypothetical protein